MKSKWPRCRPVPRCRTASWWQVPWPACKRKGQSARAFEQYQEQLAASNLAREALSTTVTTALKRLALATSTQAQRVDSVETHLASLVERQRECELQLQQVCGTGWAVYLERNAVPLVALAVAVFALGLNLFG